MDKMKTNSKPDRQALFEIVAVPKALAIFAVPTIISQLIALVYNIADAYFVGRTGDPFKIASVSIAFILTLMSIALANIFGIGGGSQLSRLLGLREDERARKVSAYSIYGSIILGLIYSILVLIFMDPLLYLLGASVNTIVYARQYALYVVVLGAVPMVLSNTAANLLRNIGFSKQASLGLSGGGILNMALDPLLMFVILPKGNEVAGAAIATLISNVASMIYFIIVIKRKSGETALSLKPADARPEKEDLNMIYSVGIPSAALTAMADIANAVNNSIISKHGDLEVAAFGMVLRAERVTVALGLGISQAMLPMVAYTYAQKNWSRMREILRVSRISGIVLCSISMVCYLIFAGPVMSFFINTSSSGEDINRTLELATVFLRYRALAGPFIFLNFLSSFGLQAIGDGRDTLIHSFIRQFIIFIPCMLIMDGIMGAGGSVLAKFVAELLSFPIAWILLEKMVKKLSGQDPEPIVDSSK